MQLLTSVSSFETSVDAFLKAIPPSTEVSMLFSMQPSIALTTLTNTNTFLSRLGSIIQRLNELHCTHQQHNALLHNATQAHTRSLPPEILGQVFDSVVQSINAQTEYPALLDQTRSLTHVCSSWRRTSIGWNSLWTQLDLTKLQREQILRTWIERSSPAALHIRIEPKERKDVNDVKELMPRIRSLDLLQGGFGKITPPGSKFERLESLCVSGHFSHLISNGVAPVLRRLHIMDGFEPLSVHHSISSNLRTLVITNIWNHRELPLFITSLNNLERLRLANTSMSRDNDEDEDENQCYTLNSLKHLRLESMYPGTGCIFRRWTCPNLKSIWYDGTYADHKIKLTYTWDLMSMFLGRSPLTESLTLITTPPECDWRIPFKILTQYIPNSGSLAPSDMLLPSLDTMSILGSTNHDLGPSIDAFLEAHHRQQHDRPTPGVKVKVFERFRLSHEHLMKWGEGLRSIFGSIEIVPSSEEKDLDDW